MDEWSFHSAGEGEREERTRLIRSLVHYAINYNNEFALNSWAQGREGAFRRKAS